MKSKLRFVFSCFMVGVFFVAVLPFLGLVEAGRVATVSVGGEPYALAITPDGQYVYVPTGEVVAVIDTSINAVTAKVTAGSNPYGVAVSPDGQSVYVTNRDSADGSVSVISTATNTVTSTVKVGGSPMGVVVSPDGAYVYVLKNEFVQIAGGNWTTISMVSVVNAVTNSVLSSVPVGGYSRGVAVSPDGAYVYITLVEGLVSVVDTSINAETTIIAVGTDGLDGVAVSLDGQYVYVLSPEKVFVISTKSNTVVATISDVGIPIGVAVSPDGGHIYVTDVLNDSVLAINTVTRLVEFSVDVGSSPPAVVVSPNGEYVYVSNLDYVSKQDDVGVDYVGTVSVVSTDPNAVGPDPSSPLDSVQLLIGVLGVVVVGVVFLVVVRMRRGHGKGELVKSSGTSQFLTDFGFNSLVCGFV